VEDEFFLQKTVHFTFSAKKYRDYRICESLSLSLE
jgi:hypothetical protein